LQVTDPEQIGPYRVLGLLGIGGMGQVYLARSPGGRTVAVKVIRPDLAAGRGFRERFAREVAAARGVSGMFTAAVVDADPDADLPWMATAYVDGPALADVVDEQGALPPDAVLALAAGLAEGLQAIHRAGLVHRDLKPSNVLLAADGPRVIDFGVSWAYQDSRLTEAGLVVGSPGFISPEQALDREVGPASDVFSLGAVLAYAASGQGPFGSGAPQGIMYRLVHEPPDLSGVPVRLRHLIDACLAKEPGHRPTTAQLLNRLAEPVSEVPLTAGPLTADSAVARLTATGPSMGGPWDTVSDGPAVDVPAPGARAERRRAWPVAAAIGCILAAGVVAIALTLSLSRQHPGPADPGRSAMPTAASSSHDTPGTSPPSMSSGQVRGSATGPASTVPSRAGTSQPAPSSAPVQSAPTPTSARPAPTRTTGTGPTPTTPATSSSPGCFLICIGLRSAGTAVGALTGRSDGEPQVARGALPELGVPGPGHKASVDLPLRVDPARR
jgi:eukaryotic-like serine/threonine-protein kinase